MYAYLNMFNEILKYENALKRNNSNDFEYFCVSLYTDLQNYFWNKVPNSVST